MSEFDYEDDEVAISDYMMYRFRYHPDEQEEYWYYAKRGCGYPGPLVRRYVHDFTQCMCGLNSVGELTYGALKCKHQIYSCPYDLWPGITGLLGTFTPDKATYMNQLDISCEDCLAAKIKYQTCAIGAPREVPLETASSCIEPPVKKKKKRKKKAKRRHIKDNNALPH